MNARLSDCGPAGPVAAVVSWPVAPVTPVGSAVPAATALPVTPAAPVVAAASAGQRCAEDCPDALLRRAHSLVLAGADRSAPLTEAALAALECASAIVAAAGAHPCGAHPRASPADPQQLAGQALAAARASVTAATYALAAAADDRRRAAAAQAPAGSVAAVPPHLGPMQTGR